MNFTLTHLGLTAFLLFGGHAAGIPFDPDHTFQFAGPCAQQEQVAILAVASVTMCDKAGHALAGAEVLVLSMAVEQSPRRSCLARAWRGVLRAQVASAAFEFGIALGNTDRWHQAGYGIGLLDHAAVTVGSVAAGAAVCAVGRLLK